jgi:hypothetical protein
MKILVITPRIEQEHKDKISAVAARHGVDRKKGY